MLYDAGIEEYLARQNSLDWIGCRRNCYYKLFGPWFFRGQRHQNFAMAPVGIFSLQ